MKKLLLFVAIAVAAMSCTKTNIEAPEDPNGAGDVTLSVSVRANSAADSRVDFDDDGEGGYDVFWLDGDKLGAWGDNILVQFTFQEFEMYEFGKEESTFEGCIDDFNKFNGNIRFVHPYDNNIKIYPYNNSNENYHNAFDANISKQTLTSDGISHLNSSTFMMSDKIPCNNQEGIITQTPTMQHLGGVMDLTLDFNDYIDLGGKTLPEGLKLVSVEVTSTKLPTVATVNMQVADVAEAVTTKKCGTITITAPEDYTATDGAFSVPLNIFPFTLEAGDQITINLWCKGNPDPESNNEANYYFTKTINIGAETKFERAVRQKVKVNFEECTKVNFYGLTTSEDPSTTIKKYEFPATKSSDTFLLSGSGLKGITPTAATLENGVNFSVEVVGDDKILVETLNDNNTANDFTDVLSVTVGAQTRTLELTQKATTELAITGFTLTYYTDNGSGGEITNNINGAKEVVFNWDETTSKKFYITPVVNNDDLWDGEISIDNYEISDNTNFTTLWDSDKGKYYIYPKAQNTSDEEYTATITCTLKDKDGNDHSNTIEVRQKTCDELLFTGFEDADGNPLKEVVFEFNNDHANNTIEIVPVGRNLELATDNKAALGDYTYFSTTGPSSTSNILKVNTKTANTSGAEYTATLTWTMTDQNGVEHTQTLPIRQRYKGQPRVTTLTNINFPEAPLENQTVTIDGIEFGFSNIIKFNDYLTFENSATLYNKTPLNGLSKIVVNKQSQTFYLRLYVDNSNENPETNEITATKDGIFKNVFTIEDDYKYFTIKNPLSVNYTRSIEIYYE